MYKNSQKIYPVYQYITIIKKRERNTHLSDDWKFIPIKKLNCDYRYVWTDIFLISNDFLACNRREDFWNLLGSFQRVN
ncbi:hypothetical protein A3Q56_01606 [Intoshia linei]|uniref:Uncharacterized protein n=1 Tax=Intoshia linei TaxID=1819745 RepID=A0A177B8Y7_9BILA|nr:hypothetical protein A3Q56_01606 [Intoshia linei]